MAYVMLNEEKVVGRTVAISSYFVFYFLDKKGTFAAVWVGKIKRKDKKRVGKLVS